MSESIWELSLDLELLVASTCRQKILMALSKVKETHMMDLVRRVNSTYTQVNRNLRILEKEDIVSSQYYGRMKMIRLNRENPKTQTILKALRMLRRQDVLSKASPKRLGKRRSQRRQQQSLNNARVI